MTKILTLKFLYNCCMYYWGVFLCCSTPDQASRLAENGKHFDDLSLCVRSINLSYRQVYQFSDEQRCCTTGQVYCHGHCQVLTDA